MQKLGKLVSQQVQKRSPNEMKSLDELQFLEYSIKQSLAFF